MQIACKLNKSITKLKAFYDKINFIDYNLLRYFYMIS